MVDHAASYSFRHELMDATSICTAISQRDHPRRKHSGAGALTWRGALSAFGR